MLWFSIVTDVFSVSSRDVNTLFSCTFGIFMCSFYISCGDFAQFDLSALFYGILRLTIDVYHFLLLLVLFQAKCQ